MPTITSSGQRSIDTLHWVGWADQDYIAARVLLLTGLVVQGTALACTAIEKYLKGVCTLSQIRYRSVGHDVSRLNGLLIRQTISLGLDVRFLRFLDKAYGLRYPDELRPGFNFALNSTATLAELDLTVQRIRRGFKFTKDGSAATTKLEAALKARSAELLTKNCAISDSAKEAIFAQPSWSYDVRVLQNGVIIEAFYVVERLLGADHFNRKGLAPVDGSEGKQFILAWPPKP